MISVAAHLIKDAAKHDEDPEALVRGQPWGVPSGYVKKAIENGHRNSGFLPIKNGDFPVRYVNVYQRVTMGFPRCYRVTVLSQQKEISCWIKNDFHVVKTIIKPAMTGNGLYYTTYKNGADWGWFTIVLSTLKH